MKFFKLAVGVVAAAALTLGLAACSGDPGTTTDANGNTIKLTEFDSIVASSVALMDKNGGVEVITESSGKSFTLVYDPSAESTQKTAIYDASQDKSFLLDGPSVLTPYAVQNLLKTQSISYTKTGDKTYRLVSSQKGTFVVGIENGVIVSVDGAPTGGDKFKSKVIYSVDKKASQYVVDAVANAKADAAVSTAAPVPSK